MKEMAKLSLTLMIVCAVAGVGLAIVYASTKPIIDQRAIEDTLNAAKSVIPGAVRVEEKSEGGQVYWIGYKGSDVVGAAVKTVATGYGGPIEMVVGLDSAGKITKVVVLSMSETAGIGSKTKEESFLGRFEGVENPGSVDIITGASISSRAVIGGVVAAQEFAMEILGLGESKAPINLAIVPDGTYEGTGEGLMGPIKVSVVVTGGKIESVKILQQDETPSIAGPALKGIPQAMVDEQKVEVDTVSGATFTSKGIIEAVRNALADTQQ